MKAVYPDDDTDIDCLFPIALHFYQAVNVPREVIEILRIGDMFGIQKDDGSHRPIQITDCWRRILDKGLMIEYGQQWKKHLSPLQYAICESGGCEKIYYTISACFQSKPDGYCALFWDVVNAFPLSDRKTFLNALNPTNPELSPYMNLWYAGAAPIRFRLSNGEVKMLHCSQGTIQGSPMGGVVFAMRLMYL